MNVLKGLFYVFLLALAIGFAIYNDQPVQLQYYLGWATIPLPIFLWAFLSFLIGLVISGILAAFSKVSLQTRIRQQKRMIAELEQKRIALRKGRSFS
jgi:uncharacterized integral membrane protein